MNETHPLIISERPWLKNILPHARKKGNIYTYGVRVLQTRMETYYRKGMHRIPKYDPKYEVNPWEYQYDLELYIWINYKEIYNAECSRIHDRIRANEDKGVPTNDLWERLEWIKENGVTGLPREEHWWNAAEIRWPTRVENGAVRGEMIRDPWAQERIKSLDKGYKYIVTMGGSGQGKTHTYCGFLLTMFEYYMHTQRGAKCCFSTTSESKMKDVSWATLVRLHSSSEKDISNTASKSIISGDYTIKRDGNKHDTGSTIRGILLGDTLNEAKLIDKLSGAHGYHFYGYLIDEGQMTPIAPVRASKNTLQSAGWGAIIMTGNYNTDDDGLGVMSKPKDGWDTVTPNTIEWVSRNPLGDECIVRHYNNSLSPAYLDDDLAKKYPHLPNKRKEKETFPSAKSRTAASNEYRRLWIGWRSTEFNPDSVLNDRIVKMHGAHKEIKLDDRFAIKRWFSLDTSKGIDDADRNRLLIFADGIDAITREWVFGVERSIVMPNFDDINTLNYKIVEFVADACKQYNMDSGIMDWSDLTPVYSELLKKGINVFPLIYQNLVPDGKTVDKYTKRRESPILVNRNTNTYGHQKCANKISLGAFAISEYCRQGKLRGINENLIEDGNLRPLSEEVYLRELKTITRASSATGELKMLDSKDEFRDKYKFSPDIFDTLVQGGYYALAVRRIPIYEDLVPQEVIKKVIDRSSSINNLQAQLYEEYL